jgi:hypothetical protein
VDNTSRWRLTLTHQGSIIESMKKVKDVVFAVGSPVNDRLEQLKPLPI